MKTGYLDSLTGPALDYEKDTQAGVELTIDESKQKGGIPERRIELHSRGNKLSPEVGLSNGKG